MRADTVRAAAAAGCDAVAHFQREVLKESLVYDWGATDMVERAFNYQLAGEILEGAREGNVYVAIAKKMGKEVALEDFYALPDEARIEVEIFVRTVLAVGQSARRTEKPRRRTRDRVVAEKPWLAMFLDTALDVFARGLASYEEATKASPATPCAPACPPPQKGTATNLSPEELRQKEVALDGLALLVATGLLSKETARKSVTIMCEPLSDSESLILTSYYLEALAGREKDANEAREAGAKKSESRESELHAIASRLSEGSGKETGR